MTVPGKSCANRTFEVKFDMRHPVPGFHQRRTLPCSGISQLHAILGLTEMDFLLMRLWRCMDVVYIGLEDGGIRNRRDISCRKSEHAHRTRNVLYGLLAEIGKGHRKLVAYLVVGRPRDAYASRLAKRLQTGRDIHPVAKDVLAIDDDIADIDSNPENDLFVLGNAGIAPEHA